MSDGVLIRGVNEGYRFVFVMVCGYWYYLVSRDVGILVIWLMVCDSNDNFFVVI